MFVSEIIDQVIEILGRSDRPKAYQRISEAVAALQDEGDWNANIGMLDVPTCSDGRSVTLPREVETPMAVSINDRPAFMRSQFFLYHLNGPGSHDRGVPWAWDDSGTYPIVRDIAGAGPMIAEVELASDAGLLVRVLGLDDQLRTLRSQLEDGTWIDGVVLEAQVVSGLVAEPTQRVFRRLFNATAMTALVSSDEHKLVAGAYMQLSVAAGDLPAPLGDGSSYYIRIIDSNTITLHTTRLDASTGTAPVVITELTAGTTLQLEDKRLVTSHTQFTSSTALLMADYDLVTFSGTTLPSPLSSTNPYYAIMDGDESFRVYGSLADAQSTLNVIDVTTPGSSFLAYALKVVSPYTNLNFTKNHNMLTGDAVVVQNSGGALPEPLISGANYFVRVMTAKSIMLFASAADAQNNINPITFTTAGSGASSIIKSIPATVVNGNSSNVITAVAHNLNLPAGSGGIATANLSAQSVDSITVSNAGTGYEEAPFVVISGGAGTGAVAQAVVSGGIITAINMIAKGTGYTSVPTVQIVPASGSYVQFSSNGTLPSPLQNSVIYRAEAPMTATTFTLEDTVPQPITITSQGSGQLFMLVSRVFSVGYQAPYSVDASNYVTGQAVRLYTQGTLPFASQTIDQATDYYLRVINGTTVELYDTYAHSIDTANTTGRISVISLGSGTLYLSSAKTVVAAPYDSSLTMAFPGFLSSGAVIRFVTDGTLPAPLATATDYLANLLSDGSLAVQTTGGADITLTSIGSGIHSMVLDKDFTVPPATTLEIPVHQFASGDVLEVVTTSVLPSPLAVNTPYWARGVSGGQIELYDTKNHALDLANTIGRLEFMSSGAGDQRTVQNLPVFQIGSVSKIQKPSSSGFIKLWCWDSGRLDNPTLLGDFHPSELEPNYRRIKISEAQSKGKTLAVRMKYKRRHLSITSEHDFINLDSGFAVMLMVRSHELMLKNFTEEAEVFRKQAVERMNKRDRSLDGPRVDTVQINSDIMSNPGDWMDV